MKVQLTRKLAAILNGVDVSAIQVGDIVELPDSTAAMLIAEGWAVRVSRPDAKTVMASKADRRIPGRT
jgi:hypothetical protein